jgi:hypothetical protein
MRKKQGVPTKVSANSTKKGISALLRQSKLEYLASVAQALIFEVPH